MQLCGAVDNYQVHAYEYGEKNAPVLGIRSLPAMEVDPFEAIDAV